MKKTNWIGLLVIFLTACSSIQPIDGLATSKLTPYVPLEKATAQIEDSAPVAIVEATDVPTAEPVIHAVALGETISSIALQYGISIDAVRRANPDANPNILIVGDELVIPVNDSISNVASDPEIGRNIHFSDTNCVPSRDAGVWCAVMVENFGDNDLEDLIVAFSFSDTDGNLIEIRYAPTMMRLIPAGSTSPAVIFLNTNPANLIKVIPSLFTVQVVDTAKKYYLPVVIEEETQLFAETEATITGKMRVESDQEVDQVEIRIGVAAFNAGGTLIGVRRFDDRVAANQSFSFTQTVYAAASKIDRVELFIEAFQNIDN